MVLRALIVLLVVLNLGVVAWWGTRAPPPEPPVAATPVGVPRLQLLREAPRAATSAPVPRPTAPAECFSFGPYPTPAALRRAHARVLAQVLSARVRDVTTGRVSGWRVFMPPFPSRAEAQAQVERMRAAGIDDLLVMPEGDDANGIALGRYGSEDAARRRVSALQVAGFAARIAPLGDAVTQGWIDVAAGAAFDSARVAQDIAAAQVQRIECALLATTPASGVPASPPR